MGCLALGYPHGPTAFRSRHPSTSPSWRETMKPDATWFLLFCLSVFHAANKQSLLVSFNQKPQCFPAGICFLHQKVCIKVGKYLKKTINWADWNIGSVKLALHTALLLKLWENNAAAFSFSLFYYYTIKCFMHRIKFNLNSFIKIKSTHLSPLCVILL